MYIGNFEKNFPNLTNATTSFVGSDGGMHPYHPWPSSANGLRIGYMEKAGKKFDMMLYPSPSSRHGIGDPDLSKHNRELRLKYLVEKL
jgi:hypothetical protein